MRSFVNKAIVVALLLLVAPSAEAGTWAQFQAYGPPSNGTTQILLVGGGGYLLSTQIANDNTYITDTDTYGAYIWDPNATAPNGATGTWQQLVNSQSMPFLQVALAPAIQSHGTNASAICPTNSSVIYMVRPFADEASPPNATVYFSTDKGQHFSASGFTPIEQDTNLPPSQNVAPGSGILGYKSWGPKMVVDPSTCNTVILGTGNDGLWYSINEGLNWSQVSTGQIPQATGDGAGGSGCAAQCYPAYEIAINPANHSDVFVFSYGNGIYSSSTGISGTFSRVNSGSGPVTTMSLTVDGGTGDLFAVDTLGDLWRWNGSAWLEAISDGTVNSAAVDPITSGHVVAVQGGGQLNESTNSGTAFGGWSKVAFSCTNDAVWQCASGVTIYNPPAIVFDRLTGNMLHLASGNGFWSSSQWVTGITSSTTITWNAQSRGTEQVVGNQALATGNGNVLLAAWDHSLFVQSGSFNTYPTQIYPTNDAAVVATWYMDNAVAGGTPNYVMIGANGFYAGGADRSSTSTNDITWTALGGDFGSNGEAYSVAVSTNQNTVAYQNLTQPQYTTNGGSSWSNVTLTGATWSGFADAYIQTGLVCADRVNANTFYMMFDASGATQGFYKSTNSGQTFTLQASSVYANNYGFIKCTPGEAGDFWLTGTPGLSIPVNPSSNGFGHITGGGTTVATSVQITNPSTMGFGAAKPGGGGYPAVFFVGFGNATFSATVATCSGAGSLTVSTGVNFAPGTDIIIQNSSGMTNFVAATVTSYNINTGVINYNAQSLTGSCNFSGTNVTDWGIWRSDDGGNTWNQVLNGDGSQYPNDSLDSPASITGDPNIWGQYYLPFSGSGFAVHIPGPSGYLLKRDLDPASNDNSPTGLARVG